MKVSIKRISEITGFSSATISNALNHKRGVNKDTSAEIFRVAKELGYISENQISKIRLVVYKHSGEIIEDTPYFTLLIDGVEKECRENGLEMTITNIDRRDPDYAERIEQIRNDATSAIMLLGTELMGGEINDFRDSRAPMLLLDSRTEDMSMDAVLTNNTDSASAAIRYLVSKGHRRIGYLKGKARIKAFRLRHAGYLNGLHAAGIREDKNYVVRLGTDMNSAYKDMLEYLEEGRELPTAYFADNDIIALGAMKALQEKNIKVPEEVSIIGYDDLPFCEISTPSLTTIRVSKQEMGKIAVRRLLQLMENPQETKTVTELSTVLIERGSVKNINIFKEERK